MIYNILNQIGFMGVIPYNILSNLDVTNQLIYTLVD